MTTDPAQAAAIPSQGSPTAGASAGATVLDDDLGPMIVARGLNRAHGSGERAVHAVNDVSFEVPRGQLCVIVGRSGSGKTSLLNVIGALDRPDSGELTIDGSQVFGGARRPADSDLAGLRRETIGFVFQSFALLPVLTAAENIGMPLRLRRTPVGQREERVRLLLDLVGLGAHGKQRPGELSGGQQQRVAIARALANTPRLLIADEPTGQLDRATGRSVMRLLRAVIAAEQVTALVATHDPVMVELADRVLTLRDGRLSEV
jgi:putative ABC transport system ATP-binding protein